MQESDNAFAPASSIVPDLGDSQRAQSLQAAYRLHRFMMDAHWNAGRVIGPDCGVRFNRRIGRFIKSYFNFLPWNDFYYYLQAQGYWVLANWSLFQQTGEEDYRQIAVLTSEQMIEQQRPDGAWDYPNPEWKGRVATAECTWGTLGLLSTYRHTRDEKFLSSALRWHQYLIHEIGFQQIGDELAINYFAKRPTARVPNNSAFVLRFLAELADATGDKSYLQQCDGMVAFMRRAQKPNGEFPYMVEGTASGTRCWEHFQCYQYNAFECLDLMQYYELTGDSTLRPVIKTCLGYLDSGVDRDGHVFIDCNKRFGHILYHTTVLGAAFAKAGRLDFAGYEGHRDRTFAHILARQQANGSFAYSGGDYRILHDRRSYPRTLSMMLFHLMVNVQTASPQPCSARVRNAS
jgi:hypothetical protein